LEIALMANMITLTPGTMSLGVSRDRKFLYVHSMFIDDPETLKREIKEGIESPLLEVMR
jgi:multicomponent Na+:H+ antiporter subunit E